MRVRGHKWLIGLAGGVALFTAACRPVEDAGVGAASPDSGPPPVSFDPETGLLLAPATREAMGIRLHPVLVRRFASRHRAFARCLGIEGEGDGRRLSWRAVVPADKAPSPGQEVALHAAGLPAGLTMRIDAVDRQLMVVSGAVELLFGLPVKQGGGLAAGGLRISYPISAERESMSVPVAAVISAALGDFVYVKTGDRLRRRRVGVGQVDGGQAEIRAGLSATDEVVSAGADQLWILELALVGGISNIETLKGEG